MTSLEVSKANTATQASSDDQLPLMFKCSAKNDDSDVTTRPKAFKKQKINWHKRRHPVCRRRAHYRVPCAAAAAAAAVVVAAVAAVAAAAAANPSGL